MNTYNYEIKSGIAKYRIEDYFQGMAISFEGNSFRHNKWCVVLTELKTDEHSKLYIPQTLIAFSGEKQACQDIIEKYRMRFLSAGG